MRNGFIIFVVVVLIIAGSLFAFRRDANKPLPKNLPPPLPDDNDQDDSKS